MGHKSFHCPKNPEVQQQMQQHQHQQGNGPHEGGKGDEERKGNEPGHPGFIPYQFHPRPQFHPRREEGGPGGHMGPRRALEDVVCFKCGYKGHYANKVTTKVTSRISVMLHSFDLDSFSATKVILPSYLTRPTKEEISPIV